MIYFVQLDSGSIKIGTTEDLQTRLVTLKCEGKTKTTLLATLPGGREEEKAIHKRFAHLRFGKTEQFKPAPELLEFIGEPLLVSVNPETVEVQPFGRITPREMYSVTEETKRQIADLASRWGGVVNLPKSQVIREAIRRCWLAEQDQPKNGSHENKRH